MKKTLLFLLSVILISCNSKDFEEMPVKFYVQKHNVKQVDKQVDNQVLYEHEVFLKIENLHSDFSINGVILKSENITIDTDYQYSILKPNTNHIITITGICSGENGIIIRYISNKCDLTNINNFILSYNNNCDVKLVSLDKRYY